MKSFRKCLRFIARFLSVSASLSLTAVALICAGYILGWHSVTKPDSASNRLNPPLPAQEANGQPEAARDEKLSGKPGANGKQPLAPRIRGRLNRILAGLRPGMNEQSAHAHAIAEIAGFSEAEIHAAMGELSGAPHSGAYHGLRMTLLSRWVGLNPEAAYAYALANPITSPRLRGEKMEDILIHMWAGHDPEGAFKKWKSLPEDRRASEYRTGKIIGAMGQKDLEFAMTVMETLPEKYHFESLKSLARTPKSDLERRQLFDRVAKLPEMKNRAAIMAQSLHGLGRDEGRELAVIWLDQSPLPRDERLEVERQLAKNWFYEDHRSAADWLLARADTPERRSEVLKDMTGRWANYDPVAAGQWLLEQPIDQVSADAMGSFAERIVRERPEEAIAWTVAIPEGAARKKAVWHVSESIKRRFPNQAEELLARLKNGQPKAGSKFPRPSN